MTETTIIQSLVLRLQLGDEAAREQLLDAACGRLRVLAKQMKADFPAVARWEETDDIYQSAMIRLCRALEDVKPNDARHFLRLAAMQIRRQLLDLARKHGGAQGLGRNHESIAGLQRPDDSADSA